MAASRRHRRGSWSRTTGSSRSDRARLLRRRRRGRRSSDAVLAPGFVDVQVNGAGTVDFATASVDEIVAAIDGLVAGGCTTCVPTIVSAPLDDYDGHARPLGDGARPRARGDRRAPRGTVPRRCARRAPGRPAPAGRPRVAARVLRSPRGARADRHARAGGRSGAGRDPSAERTRRSSSRSVTAPSTYDGRARRGRRGRADRDAPLQRHGTVAPPRAGIGRAPRSTTGGWCRRSSPTSCTCTRPPCASRSRPGPMRCS